VETFCKQNTQEFQEPSTLYYCVRTEWNDAPTQGIRY